MSGFVTAGVVVAGAGMAYAASESSKARKSVENNRRDPASEVPLIASLFPDLAEQSRGEDWQAGQQQLALDRNFAWDTIRVLPHLAEAERQATSLQRTDDLKDLRRLGTGIMTELRKANPGWGASLDALNASVASAGGRTPLLGHLNTEALGAGPSAIRSELEQQALGELALGGGLSAEDERMAQQAAREAWADRGLSGSNPGLIEEVMNRDSLSRARAAERRGFAGTVLNAGMAEDASNREFAVGVEDRNQRALGDERALLTDAVAVNQNALEPLLAFLRPRSAVGPGASAAIMGAAPQAMGSSQGLLAQLLGYGEDAANTNFNATEARAIARANNAAAIGGAAVSAGSGVASAGIKANASRQPGY